ncbi:MAG TPA: tetratricopeptide repeat protein [Pyrinomonadaceae bacterium]
MNEGDRTFLDRWAEPLIFYSLAAVCLFIYGQTVRFDFINLDDPHYVYRNGAVMSGVNAESIKWAFTAIYFANWHPLTWLSHALDVQLFGLNAGAHHAVNVVLHLGNACLAYVVFRTYTGAIWKSFLVAFLFAVHPTHVESVAWISERKDLLSTLFWLFTMLAYVRYARGSAADASILRRLVSPYFILTFVLFGLGLMAKPMVVTLPFVLLLLDLWPLNRVVRVKELVPLMVEKIPLFVLTAASSLITYAAQKAGGAVMQIERFPLESRILNSLLSYVKYIFAMFYPVNLAVWYPLDGRISLPAVIAYVTIFVSITAVAVWQFRKRPFIAVGWFWFTGTLVPVIGLVQVGSQSMADRYTYIPYFGLFIIVVWSGAELVERLKMKTRTAVAVTSTALVALSIAAFDQARAWKNSETLYTRSLAVTSNNYLLMNLLCTHYVEKAPAEYAERRCTELLDHTSNYAEAHNTIGLLRVELGRYDDAVASYRKALQIRPNTGIVYSNLSVAYSKKADTENAEKHLHRAIEIGDESLTRDALAYSYNTLGEAYAAKNDSANAASSFQTALQYQPGLNVARENLQKIQGAN